MASQYPPNYGQHTPLYGQYTPPLKQLLNQPSKQPFVIAQPEDPRSNLEKFIEKFYPNILNDQFQTDLKSQLEESRSQNGSTDFSKISLDNLRFLNLEFATPPKFDYYNPLETLNYSINYSTFTRDIQTEIGVKDKAFRLKEQAKQTLTDELQKLSLDDIQKKLEDVKKIETTDDLFGAIIIQVDQAQSPQKTTTFEFSSTTAQTQISEILKGNRDLIRLTIDKEIQQFYFYELQGIKFEKEEESKKLQTQKTQSSTNYIEPQSLKKSSSLFSRISSFFSSSYKEKTAPDEDGIKNKTKRTQSLPNTSPKAQPPKRSVKKTTSTRQNNIYSEQHPSSDFKKNQEFRNFFKPTLVDKITSAGLWLFESIKNFDFSSPSQGPEIIGSAMKAYEKFGSNPDEAKNFASFLDRKFNDEKHKNKSLTFDEFIKKQTVDSSLNEFGKVKSQSLHQQCHSQQAISSTRRARSLTNTNSNNTGQAQASRSRSFLAPGQPNPNDNLIEELLKEYKFIVGSEQRVYGSIKEKRTIFKDKSFNTLTQNQQEIVKIFAEFKRSMGNDNWNNTQHLYPPYKTSNNKLNPDQHIATALKSLNSVLSNHVESPYYNRENDLEFASALYHRISETKGFDHRKDYGNDSLHGQIQQKLGITVLAPARPPSRSR